MSMRIMIEFNNVSFSYKDKNIMENFNFKVKNGDFLVILGSNGSGKSTLAKLILGLEKISFGDILVADLSVRDKNNIREIRKKVGMILQNTDHQIINSIVEKDIAFTPENYGYSTKPKNQ